VVGGGGGGGGGEDGRELVLARPQELYDLSPLSHLPPALNLSCFQGPIFTQAQSHEQNKTTTK
jgi:hypothetical protein